MRYIFILILFISCTNQNLKSDNDQKVDDIISQMTLEEKVGQMTQINLTVIAKGPNKWESSFPMEIDDNKANKALVDYKVGSVHTLSRLMKLLPALLVLNLVFLISSERIVLRCFL